MKTRGFTLIELLVFIAIIAILMAFLVPALTRVRSCDSQVRQHCMAFIMYADQNDTKLPTAEVAGRLALGPGRRSGSNIGFLDGHLEWRRFNPDWESTSYERSADILVPRYGADRCFWW